MKGLFDFAGKILGGLWKAPAAQPKSNIISFEAARAARGLPKPAAKPVVKPVGKPGILGRAVTGVAGIGGGFLAGLGSALFGGKLGDSGSSGSSDAIGSGGSQQQSSYPRISSIFAPTSMSTRVSGPQTTKDNGCCCDQTISLLSSIDETLKRSLYISQATNLAAKETAAEGGDKKVAGLGGRMEAMKDSAEQAGFNLGKLIASVIGIGLISNLGPLLKGIGLGGQQGLGDQATNQNSDQQKGFFQDPNLLGTIGGGLLGAAFGGKKKITGAVVGSVIGSDAINGFYQAKSEEGKTGGLVGNIGGMVAGGVGGGVLGGMAAGALAGSVVPGLGTVVGGLIGVSLGIIGSVLGEDIGEAIGDAFVGKFNEEVDGEKIGKDAANELNKSARLGGPYRPNIFAGDPGYREQPKTTFQQSFYGNKSMNTSSLRDLIAKVESGNDPNIYRKNKQAIRGEDLSKLNIKDMLSKEGTAFGKFQFIPETLKNLVGEMKEKKMITDQDMFNEDTQNKIFDYQLSKIPEIQKARETGDPEDIQAAMIAIAKIWRGLPDPRHGLTYQDKYASGNKAGVSVDEYKKQFMRLIEPKENIKSESYNPPRNTILPKMNMVDLARAQPPPLATSAPLPKRNPEEMIPANPPSWFERKQSLAGSSSPQIVINNSGAAPQAVRKIANIPSIEAPRIIPRHLTQFHPNNTGMLY